MLAHLPADDSRLPAEASSLLCVARQLELPTIHGEPLNSYARKIGEKVGQEIVVP